MPGVQSSSPTETQRGSDLSHGLLPSREGLSQQDTGTHTVTLYTWF